MKNIRPKGVCPVPGCGKSFVWVDKKFFVCPEHDYIEAKYYLVDFEYKGKRIRRGTDFNGKSLTTYAAAASLRDQAFREIEGKRFDPSKWISKDRIEYKFKTLIMKWYEEKKILMDKGRRAVSYVPKLKGYIDNYYMEYFSEMDVREIMPVHIKEWYLQLPDRSPKTIKNICDALRNFFNGLHSDRVIDRELVFPSIEIAEHEPECLSPEVQMMILEKIPDVHKPIYAFMFFQGCRPGEARALKWDCINGDIVTYRRTFSTNKLVEHTKTKKIRYNLLFPETLAILPQKGFPLDFVFNHGKHKKRPYGENMLNYIYRAAVKKVNDATGLSLSTELYEHTKHSFGTQHVNNGVDRTIIKDWFGHTDMKTTEKYAKFKVVDAMRKIVGLKGVTKVSPSLK